ncbi:MAG: hypothetical protein WCO04_08390 [Pseudomonadota bacterium]|jgi:hypothetical protein
MAHYVPPKQGKLSQLFDVIVLMALTFGALYIPLLMGLAGGAKTVPEGAGQTWEAMGQNATEIAQYNALGFTDPATVANIINARYDYSFSVTALLVMVVIIVAYYVLMLKFSETEYREVIAEKFDK